MLKKLFSYAILLVYVNSDVENLINMKTLKGRLPKTTRPIEYWLRMVPDVKDGIFSGEVTVKIEINNDTNTIVLYAEELNVTSVNVSNVDKVIESSYKLLVDSRFPVIVINTIELLKSQNTYEINVKFAGNLRQNPLPFSGYYRISYSDGQQQKFVTVTQFDPIGAKLAFPCYDEPIFKTPFTISIAKYPHEKIRSNMPVDYESKPDGAINNRTWVTFQKTPPMPTYLVAFVTFEYDYISSRNGKLHVWSRREAISEAYFGLKWGERLLEKMEKYINSTYTFSKLDMVAVPGFPGAMENSGLMIFRETLLLCEEHACSRKYQNSVIETIAHEIAHQWFGNLITMNWWGSLWLKEGFATYFQYFLTQKEIGTWPDDQLFVVDALHVALRHDHCRSIAHPLTNEVINPEQIRAMYDTISYRKGASILRMISYVVGHSTFQKALQLFVHEGYEAGGVVTTNNFWTALEKRLIRDRVELNLPSSISLTEFKSALHGWTTTVGYPIIKVTSRSTNSNFTDILIEQDISNCAHCNWLIPLTKAKKSKPNFQITAPFSWSIKGKIIELPNETANNEWIVINVQQTGYYRVNYEARIWKLLIDQLTHSPESIHVLNRAQLLDDSYTLAIDDKIDFDVPFLLTTYLKNEREILPWLVAIKKFRSLFPRLSERTRTQLINYFVDCLEHQYHRIGFLAQKTDDRLTRMGRTTILEEACLFGIKDCVKQAQNEYEKHRNNLNEIDPDLKYVIYCTMLRSDETNNVIFNELWTLYKNTKFRCEVFEILRAFACSKSIVNFKKVLNFVALSEHGNYFANDRAEMLKKLFTNSNTVVAGLEVINEMLLTTRRNTTDEKKQRNLVNLVNLLRNSKVHLGKHLQMITKLEHNVKSFDENKHQYLIRALQQLKVHAANDCQYPRIDDTRISKFLRKFRCTKWSEESSNTTESSI